MSLLRSTGTVGSMTLLSRLLGFVRDVVIARIFGAGPLTDAFFVAFKIPNFLRRLFAEGAFSQAFVPVLSEYRTRRDHAEVRGLVEAVSGTLGLILLVVTAIGVISAPLLVMLFAPGFIGDAERQELTTAMLRLTFPYLLFISLTALAGGILNSYGRFAVPAFTPVLLNLSLIGAALWLAPRMAEPITALAWGVFIAGAAQLAFQLPFLARLKLLTRPRWAWRDSGVQRIIKLMLPAIFGSSVAQINLLFDTLIASFLVAGSVSWLYYADRLVEFPLGVFGIALATVLLPRLSREHATTDPRAFAASLDWGLRWVALIAVPATLGLLLLSGPMLATLFQYGEFGAGDVAMAQLALMAYAIGLTGFILVKVLAPGYFSRQDTRTPVRIAVIAMVANMGLNLLFVLPMVLLDIPGPHAGLALATSVAAVLNAALLWRGLRRDGVVQPGPGWGVLLLRIAVASAAMAALLGFATGDLAHWLALDALGRATRLLGWIVAAALVYFAVLTATGLQWRALRQP